MKKEKVKVDFVDIIAIIIAVIIAGAIAFALVVLCIEEVKRIQRGFVPDDRIIVEDIENEQCLDISLITDCKTNLEYLYINNSFEDDVVIPLSGYPITDEEMENINTIMEGVK